MLSLIIQRKYSRIQRKIARNPTYTNRLLYRAGRLGTCHCNGRVTQGSIWQMFAPYKAVLTNPQSCLCGIL